MMGVMVNSPAARADDPIPKRLRQLRKVEGFETGAAFAQALGVTPNAYGMVEAGSSRSTDMTRRIVELVPGISMDWLHTGNERFLTVEMRQRLRRVS